MPRSLWTGSLSFGLVNIPVKLYSAVSPKDVHFHLLHDADGVRIQQKRVCPADGEEVTADHLVKGYEIAPDQYVMIKPEELEALEPESAHTIDIQDFVALSEIDPIYYERSYYVAPDKRADKAYSLLLEAMRRSKKTAIARFVMRTKRYLAAIRPLDDALVLETLYFPDEVVPRRTYDDLNVTKREVDPRELAMAEQLIAALTTKFDPKKYHDEYRERVLELIERKAEGEEPRLAPPAPRPSKVINLMEALEQSIAASKRKAANESSHEQAETDKRGRKKRNV